MTKPGAQSYLCGCGLVLSSSPSLLGTGSLPSVIQGTERREFNLYPSTDFCPKAHDDKCISRAKARVRGAIGPFLWHSLRFPWTGSACSSRKVRPNAKPSESPRFHTHPTAHTTLRKICSSSQQSQCFVHTSFTALGVVAESVLQPWTPSGSDLVSWPLFLSLRAGVRTTGGAQGSGE